MLEESEMADDAAHGGLPVMEPPRPRADRTDMLMEEALAYRAMGDPGRDSSSGGAQKGSARVRRAPASIRSQVASYLREAIAAGVLQPGQAIIERQISEETTASRGSVREAVRQLEAEGLLVARQGRGTYVASLSVREACQLYEVRSVLEGLAGWLFALKASDEELGKLDEIVERMSELTENPTELLLAKNDFYEVLFTGTGNHELHRLIETLHVRVTLVRATSLARPGRPAESVAELQAIAAALRAHEPERAAGLLVEHIRHAAAAAIGAEAAATMHTPDLREHTP